jgi:Mrp family chromosome partitioning ATPase
MNLALAIAEQGHSVFFVELNLKRPRCRYVFGSPPARGVESVLLGEATPEEVTFQLGDTRIAIASVAAPMPDSLLVRPGPNLDKLLAYGESGYQWSILDLPPLEDCPAIREIATQAGPVVMVARSRRTKLNVFRRAAAALASDLDYVLLNDAG